MTRNLKALGIALAAVFALSAVIASAASAQVGTLTSTGPVTLDAVNRTAEAGTNAITAPFAKQPGAIECPNTKYTGHKVNTVSSSIPNDSSAVTVRAAYGLCTSKIGASTFPATVDMNGCHYVLELEGTTPGVDTYTVRTKIVGCETGKHITMTVWANSTLHKENKTPFCAITILENAGGYLGLHMTDNTTGDIGIKGAATGIAVTKTSPSGSILCEEESVNASLDADLTVTGTNEAGTATSIGISHL